MTLEPQVCNLQAALTRMGGSIRILTQLVAYCHEDLPIYLARLEVALTRGDSDDVERMAHAIKGLVAYVDATATMATAQRLEDMGRAGSLKDTESALNDLKQEIARLLAAMSAGMAAL